MTRSHPLTVTAHRARTRPSYKHWKMAPRHSKAFSHPRQPRALSGQQHVRAHRIPTRVTVLSKKSEMLIIQFAGKTEPRGTSRNKPAHLGDSMKNFWINKHKKALLCRPSNCQLSLTESSVIWTSRFEAIFSESSYLINTLLTRAVCQRDNLR